MAAGLGFIEFSTGDVLSAAAANGYLASQTVMVFADATARTSAIASPQEGMVSFLKDTDTMQFYTGSAWSNVDTGSSPLTTKGDIYGYSTTNARVPIGTNGQVLTADSTAALGLKWGSPAASGLTLITTQAISGVTSQSVNSCFSATYQNYLIVFSGYCASGDNNPTFKLRASGTDSSASYYSAFLSANWTNGSTATGYENNFSSWAQRPLGTVSSGSTVITGTTMTLYSPFAATNTAYTSSYLDSRSGANNGAGSSGGIHASATSYDGFTITSTTALTGTVRVYGLAN